MIRSPSIELWRSLALKYFFLPYIHFFFSSIVQNLFQFCQRLQSSPLRIMEAPIWSNSDEYQKGSLFLPFCKNHICCLGYIRRHLCYPTLSDASYCRLSNTKSNRQALSADLRHATLGTFDVINISVVYIKNVDNSFAENLHSPLRLLS